MSVQASVVTAKTEIFTRESGMRLALLRGPGGSVRLLRAALAACGTLEAAARQLTTLPPALRDALTPLCENDDIWRTALKAERDFLSAHDASLLWQDDGDFPGLLDEIASPPSVLFCRGDRAALSAPQLAIVGSRHASPAGLATARAFAADLAAAGVVITSGLALGIDAMAHEGALSAGGRTVAVLGCGADRVYPSRHAALAARIRAQGCVVTELMPGIEPRAGHFPQRNRIISGLSLGVLVVEAAVDSGSLITARFAAEQGREVFAIPGSIHSPTSKGCHQLIREGATLVETSTHIIEALGHFSAPTAASRAAKPQGVIESASPAETQLLAAVSVSGSGVDELMMNTGLPAGELLAMLNALLLRGLVHALPGGRWQLAAAGH